MKRSVVGTVTAVLLLFPAVRANASSWLVEPVCTAQAIATNTQTMSLRVTVVGADAPSRDRYLTCRLYVDGVWVGAVEASGWGYVMFGTGTFEDVTLGPWATCVEHHEGSTC